MYSFSVWRVKQNKHDQIEEDGGWLSLLRFSSTAAEAQPNTWGVRFGKTVIRNQQNEAFKNQEFIREYKSCVDKAKGRSTEC